MFRFSLIAVVILASLNAKAAQIVCTFTNDYEQQVFVIADQVVYQEQQALRNIRVKNLQRVLFQTSGVGIPSPVAGWTKYIGLQMVDTRLSYLFMVDRGWRGNDRFNGYLYIYDSLIKDANRTWLFTSKGVCIRKITL